MAIFTPIQDWKPFVCERERSPCQPDEQKDNGSQAVRSFFKGLVSTVFPAGSKQAKNLMKRGDLS
jgi:hypothetical protein